MTSPAAARIIPALDMPYERMPPFVEQMLPLGITCFKVGLITIHSIGTPVVVSKLKSLGGEVFLDAKLPDTADTMGGAATAIVAQGVKLFNLHASCGMRSMQAAVAAAQGKAKVLAVSVLTSLTEEEVFLIFGAPAKAKVLQFARDAVLAGVHGLICSPHELPLFAEHRELERLERYTPGIRPAGAAAGQQRRFATPGEAVRLGATAVIIGSPLYNPPSEIGSPVEAAKRIIAEIEEAQASLK